MAPGLASALVTQCTLGGKVTADIAVLEVDERSSQYIYTEFTPDFILCTNLFRDSIMRNGHSGFIFDKINDYLDEKTTLVLINQRTFRSPLLSIDSLMHLRGERKSSLLQGSHDEQTLAPNRTVGHD